MTEVLLICSTIPFHVCDQATCAECGQVVYPSPGTLKSADERGFKIVCVDCYHQLEDVTLSGVMHRGEMLKKKDAELFIERFVELDMGDAGDAKH